MTSPPPTKKSRWAKVPRAVLLAAQEAAGGDADERVQEHPEEGLWRIQCEFGDPVYDVVIGGWVIASPGLAQEDHTQLIAAFSPPPHVRHTALLCPPETSACGITREAASVAHHYAVAYATYFGGGGAAPTDAPPSPPLPLPVVVLGPPLNPQPLYVTIPHAKVALPALLDRIRTLHDPHSYPLISRLPLGSYICDIALLWSNAGQTIALFKA
jgi:hypothetical protein